jgi:hypothetical protein
MVTDEEENIPQNNPKCEPEDVLSKNRQAI